MSNHSLLESTWNSVALRVRQVMAFRNQYNSDIKQIAYNHLPIIEAIGNNNATLAVPLIEEHVASAGDLIVEYWDEDAQGMDNK